MIWKSLNKIRRIRMSWREIVRLRGRRMMEGLDFLEEPVISG